MRHKAQPPIIVSTPPKPELPVVPMADKAAVTILEAAELMSLGTTSIRLLIKTGKIRAVRVGKAVIIARQEIERYLAAEAGLAAVAPKYATVLMSLAKARIGLAMAKQADAELREVIAACRAEVVDAENALNQKQADAS